MEPEANDFLQAHYQTIPRGGRVLCLAEGEGRNAVFLAQQGYDVTAMDWSTVGLAKAESLAAQRGTQISTIQADLADFDCGSDAWDGIVSIWAHAPTGMRQRIHYQIVGALRPGGVFCSRHIRLDNSLMPGRGGPKGAQAGLLAELATIRAELSGLDLEKAVDVDRNISEGSLHQGMSATAQIIGRKPLSPTQPS